MRLKVLGAYGASDAEHNLTGYLLDDWLAVDAGTLTSKLSFAQQARVSAVFISHSHADHTRDLPHLIHNRFSQNAPPLVVFAARDVLDLLMRDTFNGVVWPDFSTLKSPITGEILEANAVLDKDPGIVNQSPYGDGWIVRMKPSQLDDEKKAFVTGDEYTVGVLQNQALPSIRIQPATEFYDYQAKYFRNDTQYHCPSGLTAAGPNSSTSLVAFSRSS